MNIQKIKDSIAGGGDTCRAFFLVLINANSEITVEDVSDALEGLEMTRALKEWKTITDGDYHFVLSFLFSINPNASKHF